MLTDSKLCLCHRQLDSDFFAKKILMRKSKIPRLGWLCVEDGCEFCSGTFQDLISHSTKSKHSPSQNALKLLPVLNESSDNDKVEKEKNSRGVGLEIAVFCFCGSAPLAILEPTSEPAPCVSTDHWNNSPTTTKPPQHQLETKIKSKTRTFPCVGNSRTLSSEKHDTLNISSSPLLQRTVPFITSKSVQCKICMSRFSTGSKDFQFRLTEHTEGHMNPLWQCFRCATQFRRQRDLNRHIDLCHTDDKDFVLEESGLCVDQQEYDSIFSNNFEMCFSELNYQRNGKDLGCMGGHDEAKTDNLQERLMSGQNGNGLLNHENEPALVVIPETGIITAEQQADRTGFLDDNFAEQSEESFPEMASGELEHSTHTGVVIPVDYGPVFMPGKDNDRAEDKANTDSAMATSNDPEVAPYLTDLPAQVEEETSPELSVDLATKAGALPDTLKIVDDWNLQAEQNGFSDKTAEGTDTRNKIRDSNEYLPKLSNSEAVAALVSCGVDKTVFMNRYFR